MSTLIRSAIIFLTHVRRKQIVEEYFASVSGEEEWAPLQVGRVQGGYVIPVPSRNGRALVNRTDRLDRIPA
jgi:hypothetical protein